MRITDRAGRASLLASAALVSVFAAAEVVTAQQTPVQREVREQLGATLPPLDTAAAAQLSGAFRGAAARALPAVVYIQVQSMPRERQGGADPFERFRDLIPPELLPDRRGQPTPQTGAGSGFIIDRQGYILTNRHVVRDADLVTVQLVDGRRYDNARVIGSDPQTDVAVLKIEPRAGETLFPAQLGDADDLKVGDWVLALGNPLGLQFTVTAGIVSAKGRNIGILRNEEGPAALESFIQTDAAINPGNSGGPMVDLLGRVVGINTAISSNTGYSAGYGFAVPIELARKVADDLIRYGHVRRPRIGVTVSPVDEADAEIYRLPRIEGAEIVSVEAGSPADEAGLRIGDVVVAIEGERIEESGELITNLAQRQPGERVRLTVHRYGRRLDATVRLGEFPREEPRPVAASQPAAARGTSLGFEVAAITPQRAARFELPRDARGVMVTTVDPFGPAAGLLPEGTQILRINGRDVESVQDVATAARGIRAGEAVSLIVRFPQTDAEQILNYRVR